MLLSPSWIEVSRFVAQVGGESLTARPDVARPRGGESEVWIRVSASLEVLAVFGAISKKQAVLGVVRGR